MMKRSWVAGLAVLVSTAAQASGVFMPNSPLPEEIKSLIRVELSARCTPGDWQEVATTVREDRIDQGIIDYYYTTTIRMHEQEIVVESADWAMSNPTAGPGEEVLSVTGEACR